MATLASLTRLSRRLSSLRNDQRGASAVEFAMIGAMMAVFWLNAAEIAGGVAIQRKVTLAARTVADLATRFESLNNADKDVVMGAAPAVLFPLGGTLDVTLSAVTIDADGIAKVAWSESQRTGQSSGGSSGENKCPPRAPDSVVTLPAEALKVPNSQLIWGEVCYLYKPGLGGNIIGELTLSDQIFMRPRRSEMVTRVP